MPDGWSGHEPASSAAACCICAQLLPRHGDGKCLDSKAASPYQYPCCGRLICRQCYYKSPRFDKYCLFCQISFGTNPLPQGLRDPPPYSRPTSPSGATDERRATESDPPAYTAPHASESATVVARAGSNSTASDTVHYVDPARDSVPSLSLLYGVPAAVLKVRNGLYSDRLLAARRTVVIPKEYYRAGVSFSPQPVHGAEEEERRHKIWTLMQSCKVAE